MKKNEQMESFGAGLVEVDYEAVLGQHDVIYHSPPGGGYNGLCIGNGDIGAVCWSEPERLIWAVNKCDLFDDCPPGNFGIWASEWEEKWTSLRSGCRLTVTHTLPSFDVPFLSEFEQRLDLHKAEASLDCKTPFSSVKTENFVDAETDCLVIRYRDETPGEQPPRVITLSRWGSRVFAHWYVKILRDPTIGLAGTGNRADGRTAIIEHETRSLRFAIACRICAEGSAEWRKLSSRDLQFSIESGDACSFTLYLSIVTSEEAEDPVRAAVENVDRAEANGFDAIRERHHDRWRDFWSKSFIDIPDKYIENLWYLNLYLLGSSATGRYPPNNNNLLWTYRYDIRPWSHYAHWNNGFLVSPVYTAGHPELARSYLDMGYEGLPVAQENARQLHGSSGALYPDMSQRHGYGDPEVDGCKNTLTVGAIIAMHCWRHYRYTGDEEFVRERGYPIMAGACQLYLDLLTLEADGRYHLPLSFAYENADYENPDNSLVRDSITDLSAIRALFPVTAALAERFGDDALAERLTEVSGKLVDYTIMDLPACYINNETSPPTYIHGLLDDPVEDQRMIAAGHRLTDNEPLAVKTMQTIPYTQDAPIFPFDLIGLRDREARPDLFSAMRTTVMANWGEELILGMCLCPVTFARVGMGFEALRAMQTTIRHFQQFRQGLWTEYPQKSAPVKEMEDGYDGWPWKPSEFLKACDPIWPLGIDSTRDCATTDRRNFIEVINSKDERVWVPSLPYTHMFITPGCAIQNGLNEMLLQSHEGAIRVAPAVPADWSGTFSLAAQGGFQVTARFETGKVLFVVVEATRGETCVLVNPWHDEDADVSIVRKDIQGSETTRLEGAEISFTVRAGEAYLVTPDSASQPTDVIRPTTEPRRTKPRCEYGRTIGIEREF